MFPKNVENSISHIADVWFGGESMPVPARNTDDKPEHVYKNTDLTFSHL